MVKGAAPLKDFIPRLQELVDEAENLILYNAAFDLEFLANSGLTYDDEKVVDVMENFAIVYGDWSDYYQSFKWKKLVQCADAYGYQWPNGPHDALEDAKATLFCHLAMAPTFDEECAKRYEALRDYYARSEEE